MTADIPGGCDRLEGGHLEGLAHRSAAGKRHEPRLHYGECAGVSGKLGSAANISNVAQRMPRQLDIVFNFVGPLTVSIAVVAHFRTVLPERLLKQMQRT